MHIWKLYLQWRKLFQLLQTLVMRKFLWVYLLVSICCFNCFAQKNNYISQSGISFITNTDSFLNLTNKPQKPYFIYFTASWCAPCKQLHIITFADKEVVKYVDKNVLALKVDVDIDKTLRQKYYVSEYPTVLVFDKTGAMKMRFEGFFTAEIFLETLKKLEK